VAPANGTSESIALLDIGSNALRCLLARIDGRPGFEILTRQRVQTRLGDASNGLLPRAAIDATVAGVGAFLAEARRGASAPRVLAVATAAVRDAENRTELLRRLSELGVGEVRILSGREEAELGAEAALRALPVTRGLVADLGGGSLQVTRIERGNIVDSGSVPLGVARLMRRFLQHDPPKGSELTALRGEVREQIRPLLRPVAPASEGTILASGGIVKTLARLEIGRAPEPVPQPHGYVLTLGRLRKLREKLAPLPLTDRAAFRGLKAERADVIVPGAIVLEELLENTGYAKLTVCSTSVREGVLWREAQKLERKS
jgi:exopolyphosphatase / guanosine-5'-triphosphate,3'-diphosphate pyrophosphatase